MQFILQILTYFGWLLRTPTLKSYYGRFTEDHDWAWLSLATGVATPPIWDEQFEPVGLHDHASIALERKGLLRWNAKG